MSVSIRALASGLALVASVACVESATEPRDLSLELVAEWVAPAPPLLAGPDVGRSVTVRVTNARGRAVVGMKLRFVVVAGGGEVDTSEAVTNGEGCASVVWSFGSRAGVHRLQAFAPSVTDTTEAIFEAEVLPGPPVTMRFSMLFPLVRLGDDIGTSVVFLDAGGNVVGAPGPVTYSSADESIATISAAGVVTGVSEGPVVLTATNAELSDTALVSVGPYVPIATVTEFAAHPSVGIAISPGRVVLIPSYTDNRLARVDAVTGTVLTSIQLSSATYDAAVLPDGSRAYASSLSATAVHDVDLFAGLQSSSIGLVGPPLRTVVAPDGSALFVSDFEGRIYRINLATQSVTTYTTPFGGVINGLALSTDGQTLIYSSMLGYVGRLDAATFANASHVLNPGIGQGIAFSADGSSIFVASEGGAIRRLSALTLAFEAQSEVGSFFDVKPTPNGFYLVAVRSYSSVVEILDPQSLELVLSVPLGAPARRIAIEPVSGAIWVTTDGAEVWRIVLH